MYLFIQLIKNFDNQKKKKLIEFFEFSSIKKKKTIKQAFII